MLTLRLLGLPHRGRFGRPDGGERIVGLALAFKQLVMSLLCNACSARTRNETGFPA